MAKLKRKEITLIENERQKSLRKLMNNFSHEMKYCVLTFMYTNLCLLANSQNLKVLVVISNRG